MLITTNNDIPGQSYKVLGLVSGNSVQAVNIGKDLGSAFKNIIGGEMTNYTELMTDTRETALKRMVEHATSLGADAVIAMRFGTSTITNSGSEVLAYGTAVKFD